MTTSVESPVQPAVRWITLGTSGGPFQTVDAAQISNALEVDGAVYLFDVGNGVLRQLAQAGHDVSRVRAVFATHHHLDHVADLGLVVMSRWLRRAEDALEVRGPGGTERLVDQLCLSYALTESSFGEMGDGALRDSVRTRDVPRGGGELVEVYRDERVRVESIDVEHFHTPWASDRIGGEAEHAVGFRITVGDRVIAYTGDAGPCPALAELARGADLLVSEVADPDAMLAQLSSRPGGASEAELRGVGFVMRNCHLEAREIAYLAQEAEVRRVVLTHFVPYPDAASRARIRETLLGIEPGLSLSLANDLDGFEVSAA